MRSFLYRGLLIGAAIVVTGCVGPQTNMGFEERVRADGYPPEYVEGYMAGFKSYCAEIFTDKLNVLDIWVAEANWKAANCIGQNLEVMGGQDPKGSKSYQQGRDDGKIAARSSFLSYRQYMQEARQIQEMSRMIKPLSYQELKMLNQPFDKFDKE
jgi:hypothetical protein